MPTRGQPQSRRVAVAPDAHRFAAAWRPCNSSRNVGPNSTYPTIAAAVGAAAEGDIIRLESGYSNERAVLTVQDLIVQGGAFSLNIDLVLGPGINDVTLAGLADIDVFDNSGNNAITGNGGDNELRVARGTDTVLGGDGFDRLVVDYADAVTSVIGTMTSVTDGGANSVTFDASVEDFTILTGSGDDNVTAGDGWNLVRTGGGNDTVTLGDGINTVDSGAGNDTVTSDGYIEVRAGTGDDTVTTGDRGGIINSGNGNNIVTTGAGSDLLYTGRGNDSLITGAGADEVRVNGGTDTLDAGGGEDLLTIQYGHLRTNVTGNFPAGSTAKGFTGLMEDGAGNSIDFSGVEHFHITTGSGNDEVRTGSGEDTLYGGAGHDFLHAGVGRDWLSGGAGADTLIGGRGGDLLNGGTGADVFRFDDLDYSLGARHPSDVIFDLQAKDTLDLAPIDANVNEVGDQAFVVVGRFSGTAGEAVITRGRDSFSGEPLPVTWFSLDTDGDGRRDIRIVAYGDQREFDNILL